MKKLWCYVVHVIGAALGGVLVAMSASFIAVQFAPQGDFTTIVFGLLGVFIGYPVGVFVTGAVLGKFLYDSGSLLFGFLGLVGAAVLFFLLGIFGRSYADLFLPLYVPLLPLGFVAGYVCKDFLK